MRKLLFFSVVLLAFALAFAAPLHNQPIPVKQPDGTSLTIYASGDEFHNWLHDADNYTIVQDDSGRYVYAQKSGDGVAPTALVVGVDSPAELNLAPGINLSPERIAAKYARYQYTMRDYRNSRSPHTGVFNNIVIFIKFADDPEFSSPLSQYDNMFNASGEGDNSMVNFFHAASYGQLTINTSFYPQPNGELIVSYTDTHPRNYFRIASATNTIGYDANNDNERTQREMQLLARAVAAVGNDIPQDLVIDGDNDGYVDNTCFIIQGAPDGWAELLWPHRWVLYGATATIHGKQVWDFNFQLEFSLYSEGASVLSHEMFHSLGSPDLYRYTDTSITPIGDWDLMSNNHNPPQHMSAWMKYRYGEWLPTPPTITQSGTYTLSPVATSSTNNIYRIQSWLNNQYYVLEYRRSGGMYDDNLPGEGLLVYRLDTSQQGNAQGPPDELYIYRPGAADNQTQGSLSSAYLSAQSGRTAITEATIPNGFMQNNAPGGLNLYDIGTAGETITFKVKISEVQLTSPTGGEEWFAGTNKTIRWKAKSTSGTVTLEYTTNAGDSWQTISSSAPNNGSFLWTNLPQVNSTQCQVKITLNSNSQWDSSTYPFVMLTELAMPVGSSPANGAVGVPTNPQVTWNDVPGATGYQFQLSADAQFSTFVVNVIGEADNYYQITGLQPFSTYYWRVASMGDVGVSPFCETLSFTTGETSELPGVPDLLSPADYAPNVSLTPEFTWNAAYLAASYRIQISPEPYFMSPVQDVAGLNSTSFIATSLQPDHVYYWRVAAVNVAGISNFSLARRFTTRNGSPNDDELLVPMVDRLEQNSPNPFVNTTTIAFSLKHPDRQTRVEIYNLKGQLVRRLYQGIPGKSAMQLGWDGKDEQGRRAGSGIYLYKLSSGEFNTMRKMLLVK